MSADKEQEAAGEKANVRVFRIDHGATLEALPAGAQVRVWLPVPPSNDHQEVKPLEVSLPAESATAVEPKYGNKILYFEAKAPSSGNLSFHTPYLVQRRKVRTRADDTGARSLPADSV